MSLNLIRDPWIPVATASGPRIIRPDQMAERDVLFPDWPRPDLNIACIEFLIGLVALADPPAEAEDWLDRALEPERLRDRLAPLAEAFELDGDAPRFLQDLEPLAGDIRSPDLLFIDAAGAEPAEKNTSPMAWGSRYLTLDPALAAMGLYALQAHAPAGGRGNRTSMRGGGPLVTLVEPAGAMLRDIVWANTPCGAPQGVEALPWMRSTRVSDKGQVAYPPNGSGIAVEAFFGMPRRLRLVFEDGRVTGVIQRPYGTNYGGWRHPLTPYYRLKEGQEALPVHPRAGLFGYRNWLGVVAKAEKAELRDRAAAVTEYLARIEGEGHDARIIVAGWAMDNMKPRDFTWSRQPLVALSPEKTRALEGMIEAAETLGSALRQALKPVAGEGAALENLREEFFLRTDAPFRARLAEMQAGAEVGPGWLGDMRRAAMAIFDAAAVPGLADRRIVKATTASRAETGAGAVVAAREFLRASFAGYGKLGAAAFVALGLPPPEKRKQKKARGAA